MDGLGYTTIIEPAEPLAYRRGSALDVMIAFGAWPPVAVAQLWIVRRPCIIYVGLSKNIY
jgi:hypothetical protein